MSVHFYSGAKELKHLPIQTSVLVYLKILKSWVSIHSLFSQFRAIYSTQYQEKHYVESISTSRFSHRDICLARDVGVMHSHDSRQGNALVLKLWLKNCVIWHSADEFGCLLLLWWHLGGVILIMRSFSVCMCIIWGHILLLGTSGGCKGCSQSVLM